MTQMLRLVVCVSLLALGGAIDALAQTSPAQKPAAQAATEPEPLRRGFLNVSGGYQAAEQSFDISGSFPLHDETATFSGSQKVGGGGLFDISGGARVWRNLYIGLAITTFSDKSDATISASIPDPLVFDRPVTRTASAANLEHKETGVHVQATWIMPVTVDFDVALSVGPSFFSVKQGLVSGIAVAERTTTLGSVNLTESSESAAGFNIGIDGTYLVTPRFGGGVFLRYTGGSVTVGNVKVDAGGFQIGGGVRVRF